MKNIIKTIALITIGTFIFSIAVNSAIIPNEMGEGGITGVNMLLLYVFGFNPALSNLVINIVILFIGWKLLEKQTIYYTLYAIVMMSFFIQFVKLPVFVPQNTILPPIMSGILIGTGVGTVLAAGGTTAGTDIIGLVINKFFGVPVSAALFSIDALIITSLSMVIGLEKALLSLVSTFITSRVINFIMNGRNPKRSIMIISDQHEAIGEALAHKINRGITIINGYGYYSKAEKHIMYVVVNQIQLSRAQRVIHEIDPKAFVTVTEVQQVAGEGFSFFHDDKVQVLDEEIL